MRFIFSAKNFARPYPRESPVIACRDFPGREPRDWIAAELVRLDLEGHGIRGMDYIPALGGYLLTSGPVAREQTQFRLWFWRGQAGEAPRRVTVPGLQGFEHAEGVSTATVAGRQRIIIVSDDGSRKEGRCARYLLLDLDQLQIDWGIATH